MSLASRSWALRTMTTVLLVEDREEIWDVLSRRLKRRGFDVVVATDGQEGVDPSKSESPDVILLDMNLPTLDVWTAAAVIRAAVQTT